MPSTAAEVFRGEISSEKLAIITKRLNDGFYERDLVRRAIARRVLDDLETRCKPPSQIRDESPTTS